MEKSQRCVCEGEGVCGCVRGSEGEGVCMRVYVRGSVCARGMMCMYVCMYA